MAFILSPGSLRSGTWPGAPFSILTAGGSSYTQEPTGKVDPVADRIIGHEKEDPARARQRLQVPEQGLLIEARGQLGPRIAHRHDPDLRSDLDPRSHLRVRQAPDQR